MVKRSEEEGSEFSFCLAHLSERLHPKQSDEKPLSQILSVMRSIALASNITVKRQPISPAQLFEGRRGLRRVRITRQQDDAPVRGSKSGRAGRGRVSARGLLFVRVHDDLGTALFIRS